MVDFHFELVHDGHSAGAYALGHVTIKTNQGTGTSRPDHSFMVAVSLGMLLAELTAVLQHGKISGCHWGVIDASYSVAFLRETRRLKGQEKPIRIVCGGLELGTVFERELVQGLADGSRRFLQEYAGQLGEDETDLTMVIQDFVSAFGLGDDLSA